MRLTQIEESGKCDEKNLKAETWRRDLQLYEESALQRNTGVVSLWRVGAALAVRNGQREEVVQ